MNLVRDWFTKRRGYTPFAFQEQAWDASLAGASGLVHAPTGMGKTFAVALAPMMRWAADHPEPERWPVMAAPPLTLLWITPLRALATDTLGTLREPIAGLGLPWTIELRTGDVSASIKARQKKRLPTVLVTTPESLSLLLSYADARAKFAHLQCVVVDEWHELMATKRGTQTELALARLRRWTPPLQTWGLSATLGNLDQARDVLLGCPASESPPPCLIHGDGRKPLRIETLIPADLERFPWAGHLGLKLLPQVLDELDRVGSALLFTNTRSQAELWFANILKHRPDWIGEVALHHGSLDRQLRNKVEDLLREGALRCVVCTSSLDLGVDFSPVDRVIQVGSPKGVARLMQRAGRSGHQPGAVSRVLGVPTHAFELIEFAAARAGVNAGHLESRRPLDRPVDVLVQHLVTIAAGGGFDEGELYEEVTATHAFRHLTEDEWQWAMDFVTRGGKALYAYPHYCRIARQDGRYQVSSQQIARQHRMGIGTITSDASMTVRLVRGRTLGSVEESFIARLRPGDRFLFAGLSLELVRTQNMTAHVRRATRLSGNVPRWQGGKSPLSTQLADAVRAKFDDALAGRFDDPEMQAIRPLLELQRQWSLLPARDELLIEAAQSPEGHHLFLYPFQGRLVHEGLGALLAYRLSRQAPRSITATVNDYGLELLCPDPLDLDEAGWRRVLTTDRLVEDLLACLNATELARRQFREIARVAGLIFTGFPGQAKSTRQLQASSELFYQVFTEFDADNLLLDQARREVLEQQLEIRRLKHSLERITAMRIVQATLAHLSPLAFPLWAEHLRENHVTSEPWADRVRAMAVELELAADEGREVKPPRDRSSGKKTKKKGVKPREQTGRKTMRQPR